MTNETDAILPELLRGLIGAAMGFAFGVLLLALLS